MNDILYHFAKLIMECAGGYLIVMRPTLNTHILYTNTTSKHVQNKKLHIELAIRIASCRLIVDCLLLGFYPTNHNQATSKTIVCIYRVSQIICDVSACSAISETKSTTYLRSEQF